MEEKKFNIGDRVRIAKSVWWANTFSGTVAQFPGEPNAWRHVKGLEKTFTFYWVDFDEAQIDGDGDGPYASGEIEEELLSPLESKRDA